jgi:hypothetical protein
MRLRVIAISLLGALSIPAATLNGLYFGLDNMRGFAEVYWWFLPDGRVLRDTLPAGVTPAAFDAACLKNAGFCGTYTLSGDKMAVKIKNGQTENWTYKTLNGGIQLNYLILTPVEKYPAGSRLDGTWSRAFSSKMHSSPGSNMTVTAPSFYSFKPDGTYTFEGIAGVETESAVKGASGASSQQTQISGTYTVRDYSLTLAGSGKNEQHIIFPAPGGNLNIDGMVFKKQPK